LGPAPLPEPCISGFSSVEVLGKGDVLVQDLQVGDKILVPSTSNKKVKKYETVYGFGHKNSAVLSRFLKIETKDNEDSLEISEEHLLYKAHSSSPAVAIPVRADSVRVGDHIFGSDGNPIAVTKITQVIRRGVYSPLTRQGSFVASGTQVSSYTATNAHPQYFLMGSIKLLSHHDISHVAMTPYRFICGGESTKYQDSVCSLRNHEGQLLYAAMGERVAWFVDKQGMILQSIMAGIVLAPVIPLYLLERSCYSDGANCLPTTVQGTSFVTNSRMVHMRACKL